MQDHISLILLKFHYFSFYLHVYSCFIISLIERIHTNSLPVAGVALCLIKYHEGFNTSVWQYEQHFWVISRAFWNNPSSYSILREQNVMNKFQWCSALIHLILVKRHIRPFVLHQLLPDGCFQSGRILLLAKTDLKMHELAFVARTEKEPCIQ